MGFSPLTSGRRLAISLCLEFTLWEAHTQGHRVGGGKLLPDIWTPVTILIPRPTHLRESLIIKLDQKAGVQLSD